MGSKSKDTYGAESQGALLYFDPDKLVIPEDESHWLYDARAKLPINEAMVQNIMQEGVILPVRVLKDKESGETLVVDGRQRVKNAREANLRLVADGQQPIVIPAVAATANELSAFRVMVSANNFRTEESPLQRANKMARMREVHGMTDEQIALSFGCNVQTVRNTIKLTEQTASLRKAVDSGKIGLSIAQKLYKLDGPEQKAAVEEIIEATAGDKGHKKAAKVRKIAAGDQIPRLRGRKEVTSMMQRLTAGSPAYVALAWALGSPDESFAPAPLAVPQANDEGE